MEVGILTNGKPDKPDNSRMLAKLASSKQVFEVCGLEVLHILHDDFLTDVLA